MPVNVRKIETLICKRINFVLYLDKDCEGCHLVKMFVHQLIQNVQRGISLFFKPAAKVGDQVTHNLLQNTRPSSISYMYDVAMNAKSVYQKFRLCRINIEINISQFQHIYINYLIKKHSATE